MDDILKLLFDDLDSMLPSSLGFMTAVELCYSWPQTGIFNGIFYVVPSLGLFF